MEIFFTICQKMVRKDKIISLDKFSFEDSNSIFNYCMTKDSDFLLLRNFITNIYSLYKNNVKPFINENDEYGKIMSLNAKAKIKYLYDEVANMFYSKEHKERLLVLFSKVQRIYYAFLKFMLIYKYKKYKTVVEDDLSLNKINIKNNNVMCIIQKKCIYLFTLNDLLSIINSALSNAAEFFIDVYDPKNPYNNIIFDKSTLYNIYFKMKKSSMFSTLFHLFFINNFDKTSFFLNNESYIRDYSIKRYVYNTPTNIIYYKILHMININIYTRNLKIDEDFSTKLLVDIMKPFFHCYCTYIYGVTGTEKIYYYKKLLNYKMKVFYEFNKSFGRKICKIIFCNNKKQKMYYYNTNHINFYDIPIDNDDFYNYNYANEYHRINGTYELIEDEEEYEEEDEYEEGINEEQDNQDEDYDENSDNYLDENIFRLNV